LSREILRRRLALLRQAITQQKDKTAEEKLAEWGKYTDLLKEFKENGNLSETSLEELENQLQALKEMQDQISQDAPGLEDAMQSIHQKVLEKHLQSLKAFEEKHPQQALPLLNRIMKKREAIMHQEVVSSKQPLPTRQRPASRILSRLEMKQISDWLKTQNLNKYGDPLGTNYAGGTPLFNESTGKAIGYFQYLLKKFPNRPWRDAWQKKKLEGSLEDYSGYLNLWHQLGGQVKSQLAPSANSATPSEAKPLDKTQLYKLNNERLKNLNEIYKQLPPTHKKVIEGFMSMPEETRQMLEEVAPKLRAEFRSNRPTVPEAVRQKIQSRIRKIKALQAEQRKGQKEKSKNNSVKSKMTSPKNGQH